MIRLPNYLPKDSFATLVIGFIRLNGNQLVLPYSYGYKKDHKPIVITIPPVLLDKKVKEIRIIPKANARFFEIQYTYEALEDQRNLNKNNALAIDLGLNNLVTCVTSTGRSFIIDGRRLKSINQGFNKQNAKLQSIKDKQGVKGVTKLQVQITNNRNNKVNDYINKTCRYIVNYCLKNDIGTLVIGYNETFQRNIDIGKRNNQHFVNIPQDYVFSGKRVKRGLYKTKNGTLINADINGALNILHKSNAVDLQVLRSRGEVDTPLRIRVA